MWLRNLKREAKDKLQKGREASEKRPKGFHYHVRLLPLITFQQMIFHEKYYTTKHTPRVCILISYLQ
jgi:hypothetical protein